MLPISTPRAPAPRGHYAQAIVANGFVFVSTQLPLLPDGAEPAIPPGVAAQTCQVIANIARILAAAGADLSSVVSVTVYVTDMADWSHVNAAFADAFGPHKPARGVVATPALHLGAQVAMQVVAVAAASTGETA